MNLYDLKEQYIQLLEFTEEHGEDEHVKATMDGIEDDIETKADNYAHVIAQLEYEEEMFRKEGRKLYDKAKQRKNRREKLKKNLEDTMNSLGKKKFKTDMHSFNIQNNPPSVQIDKDAKIPDEFLIHQAPKPDKNALREFLEAGNEIEGVNIKQTEGLRIR